MKATVPALAAALALAGCSAAMPGVPSVPPLPAETIPLPPVSEQTLIWRPGDWVYVGGSYRYEPGQYEPRGTHGALWIRGHWEGNSASSRWVPGSWS